MADARREVLKVMAEADHGFATVDRAVLATALDAIPPDVLARYAVERGARLPTVQGAVHIAAGLDQLLARARSLLNACEDEPALILTQSASDVWAVLSDLTEFVTGVRQGLGVA